MRNIFSAALKSNPFLEKGLMTGILRVSKNNMLSGLNNLKIYSLLDNHYNQYFGFTESEVNELMQVIKIKNGLNEIKKYYNGYYIGDITIYNPWSLMNYLEEKKLMPYWVLTSNDHLLKDSFLQSDELTKIKLSNLMQGQSITESININLCYEDLMKDPHTLWTLLLFCGYLTIENKKIDFNKIICQLKIPNEEIISQYREIFSGWLQEKLGQMQYKSFLTNLVNGNVELFTYNLSKYLMDSLSFHDIHGNQSEKFYHGFVAGLVASIRDTHWIDSNKESGSGLYDLILIPKDLNLSVSTIIEFKQVKTKKLLKNAATKALNQIEELAYSTTLNRYQHITSIIKVGLVFCEKAVMAAYQQENLLTHKNSILTWTPVYANNR
jgi:hypothetical protein